MGHPRDPRWNSRRCNLLRPPKRDQTRRCRASRTDITVARAEELGFDPEPGPWVVVCEDHNTVMNFDTKAQAMSHAAWPEWCDECQAYMKVRGLI